MKTSLPHLSKRTTAIALAVLILPLASGLHADEKVWLGIGNNAHNANYWSPSGIPTVNDLLIFNETSNTSLRMNNYTLSGGAFYLTGSARTAAQYIEPWNADPTNGHKLFIAGYNTTLGGQSMNLLLGNDSRGILHVTNRTAGGGIRQMEVILGASGTIYAENDITLGAPVTDGGNGYSIRKVGAGILTLGDVRTNGVASTFSGGVVLEEGTLMTYSGSQISGGSITFSSLGTGALTLRGGTLRSMSANSRTYHNAMVLDGNVTLGQNASEGGGSGTLILSGSASQTTTVSSDSRLHVENTVLWGQTMVGSGGITKTGNGTLAFSASAENYGYTGDTVVEAGNLVANGVISASNITVKSGGRFRSGSDVYGNVSVESGGTLGAGGFNFSNSTETRGAMNVYGDLTLDAGSRIEFVIGGALSDQIYLEGNGFLHGAELAVTLGELPLAGETFVLIDNGGFDPLSGLLSLNGNTLTEGATFHVVGDGFSQAFQITYQYTDSYYSESLAITAIPEPGSISLIAFATGLIGMRSLRRKRLNKTHHL